MPMNGFLVRLIWVLVLHTSSANAELSGHNHLSLVISISRYDNVPDVPNAEADAQAIAKRLSELGYGVFHLRNPNQEELLRALAAMRLASSEASQVIVYLAGHGVQNGTDSYFLTRDTKPTLKPDTALKGAVPLSTIIHAFSDKPRQKIILFDACRTPPELSRSTPTSATPQSAPAGLFLAYAAGAGQPAYDGADDYSPFAASLLRQLHHPERPLTEILRRARLEVISRTGGRQIPWVQSSLLRPARLAIAVQTETPSPPSQERFQNRQYGEHVP